MALVEQKCGLVLVGGERVECRVMTALVIQQILLALLQQILLALLVCALDHKLVLVCGGLLRPRP
jgi:hypothetical protein